MRLYIAMDSLVVGWGGCHLCTKRKKLNLFAQEHVMRESVRFKVIFRRGVAPKQPQKRKSSSLFTKSSP